MIETLEVYLMSATQHWPDVISVTAVIFPSQLIIMLSGPINAATNP